MLSYQTRSYLCYALLLLICLAVAQTSRTAAQDARSIPLYIGTYTNGISQGIYRSELNLSSGKLAKPQLVAELVSPSFLAIHPTLDVLYAVSEVSRGEGRDNTQVMAYKIQPDGRLTALGGCPAGGDGPCYISTDKAGEFAFVANYGSGSIAAMRLNADGSLGQTTSHIQHTGSSINPRRQQSPHAHCIVTDPSDQFVCAVDLGLDQILVYRLQRDSGELVATGKPLKTEPGGGPRHFTFHPDGKHAFVIHEISSKLSSCRWDSQTGTLELLQTVSTLPNSWNESNSTAEVLVHPSGKFVYGSNRGHNTIAAFAFNTQDGSLQPISHTPTGGKTPRNFRIDPSGRYLLAENQGSDSVFVFQIDEQTGELTQVGDSITVGAPCCIRFLQR